MFQSQIIGERSLIHGVFQGTNYNFYYKKDTKKHSALVNFIEDDSLTFFL